MDSVSQEVHVCRNPACVHQGLPQSVDNFYRREGGKYLVSECKDCMKVRSATQATRRIPKNVPYHPTELIAINRLAQEGIHALPGKAFASSYADIVAWGCVPIEVKYASRGIEYKRGVFHFVTTAAQRRRGFIADLVMLICDYEERQTFHLFPVTHEVFYMKGRMKTGFVYDPGNPKAGSRHTGNRSVMTDSLMTEYEDRWDLIEAERLRIAEELRTS